MSNNSVCHGELKGFRNTLQLLWITWFNWWLYHKLCHLSQSRTCDEEFCQKPTERGTCIQWHILQVSGKFSELKDVAKKKMPREPPGILLHGSRRQAIKTVWFIHTIFMQSLSAFHGDRLHSSNVLCLSRRPLKTQCNEKSCKKKNKNWEVQIGHKIH